MNMLAIFGCHRPRLLRPHLFLLLALVLCSHTLASEQDNVDNLKSTLAKLSADDSARIAPLIALSKFYLYLDPKKSTQYATQALAFTNLQNNNYNKAEVLRLLGHSKMYQGLNKPAFKHLTEAINSANATDSFHLKSVANRAMGVFHELLADHDNSMKYYIEALKFAKASDNKSDLAMVFNNLGNVLNSQNDYVNAAKYFEQSITINTELNDIEMIMNASVGLSVSSFKSGDIAKAKQLLESILSNESPISNFTFSEASVNLAHIHKSLKDFSTAQSLYEFVINDERGSAYPPAVAAAYLGLAEVFIKTNQITKATDVYKRGIFEVKDKISVESEMSLYENLAKLELSQGNFEGAAKTQSQYITRRNQIQPLLQAGIVQKLEHQLQMERDHIALQKKLLVSELESKHASLYLLAIIIISLVTLVLFLLLKLRKQVISRLEATNKTLKVASETDHLTGIGNRRFLDHKINQLKGQDIAFAFLLLDIDHFKEINDNFGHDVGDEILIAISATINKLCRHNDLCARIGGEEFVILCMNINEESACLFAERVRCHIERMARSFESTVTASIGLSVGNMKSSTYDDLYKQADTALYLAKSEGRNKVIKYAESANAQLIPTPHT